MSAAFASHMCDIFCFQFKNFFQFFILLNNIKKFLMIARRCRAVDDGLCVFFTNSDAGLFD